MINILKNNFDEYSLKARIFSSFIGLIPLLGLVYYFLELNFETNIILSSGLSGLFFLCAVFFISDIIRNFGKYAEKKIFSNELYFPTTDYLLGKSVSRSVQRYDKIRSKVLIDFGIKIPEYKNLSDNKKTRTIFKELVGEIRQVVKDGRLVLQFNIRYGFWRNLIGFSPVSIGICIISIVYFSLNQKVYYIYIFSILFVIYSLLFIFRRRLLQFLGFQYAEQLFLEYLGKND